MNWVLKLSVVNAKAPTLMLLESDAPKANMTESQSSNTVWDFRRRSDCEALEALCEASILRSCHLRLSSERTPSRNVTPPAMMTGMMIFVWVMRANWSRESVLLLVLPGKRAGARFVTDFPTLAAQLTDEPVSPHMPRKIKRLAGTVKAALSPSSYQYIQL